jgi:ApeA N-terminal domain 1
LDAVRQPDDFCRVLASWLDRDDFWRDARGRFSNCFAKENSYDVDRLIGAANMFDILPSSAVPLDVPLSKELEEAGKTSRKAFRALPRNPERDSVLGALGRVGKPNLKHKVRHRAEHILKAVGNRFPELPTVTDEAVNCRNFYVHGGEASFDYSAHFDAVTFFTQTLEFVFAAADLVEAGWDVKAWSNTSTTMSHPFARYRVNYKNEFQELKALLP